MMASQMKIRMAQVQAPTTKMMTTMGVLISSFGLVTLMAMVIKITLTAMMMMMEFLIESMLILTMQATQL
jgi:hypothetical protein